MVGEGHSGDARHDALNDRIAATEARIAANQARIADLQAQLERLSHPVEEHGGAGNADGDRLAALEVRADRADTRSDTWERRSSADRDRIWALEGRANVDAVLIAELQADGLIRDKRTGDLEMALHTSRTIGAAIGILMARHNVTEPDAFQLLRKASMDGNRKLRVIAEDVVLTGDLPARAD